VLAVFTVADQVPVHAVVALPSMVTVRALPPGYCQ
jgi:hypothetical protein